MTPIRIRFTGFWHGGSEEETRRVNPIFALLDRHFEVEWSDDPDYLVYSCFGRDFERFNCTRIFYTGENRRPNYLECDYSFGFDYPVTDRHYRLPLYGIFAEIDEATRVRDVDEILKAKTGFCSFIYSNPVPRERRRFFEKLSRYKPVDSGGHFLNNVGGPVADKIEFARSRKFAIAFENESFPGYTTEKLLHALVSDAVPIYWGNPLVARDFNPRAFINAHDFPDLDAVVDHVMEVDQDPALYRRYLSEPCFVGNRINDFVDPDNILARFERIFAETGRVPVARTARGRAWRHLRTAMRPFRSIYRRLGGRR